MNQDDHAFAEAVRRLGLVPADDVAEAVRVLTESGEQIPLAAFMVRRGLLTQDQVDVLMGVHRRSFADTIRIAPETDEDADDSGGLETFEADDEPETFEADDGPDGLGETVVLPHPDAPEAENLGESMEILDLDVPDDDPDAGSTVVLPAPDLPTDDEGSADLDTDDPDSEADAGSTVMLPVPEFPDDADAASDADEADELDTDGDAGRTVVLPSPHGKTADDAGESEADDLDLGAAMAAVNDDLEPGRSPTDTGPGTETPLPAVAPDDVDRSGEHLGGFLLVECVGRGGMGRVYRAVQEKLDRTVAVKVLRPDLGRNAEYVERFFSEARTAARLSHPHIVQIIDVGEERGVHYFAMEYVGGITLQERLARDTRMPIREALKAVLEACAGLAHAHSIGLVHRDIKPDNLMVDNHGRIKITDFGLAKVRDKELGLTRTGIILGTPYYMSPEQSRGESVDHRTDIYSLGATLFHLVTGSPPFTGDNAMAVAVKHVTETLSLPEDLAEHMPAGLFAVIERMMAKDPDERPADAEEVARDLAAADVTADAARAEPRAGARAAPPPETPTDRPARRPAELSTQVRAAAVSLSGRTVMVVDADESLRLHTTRMLRKHGVRVTGAGSGLRALELIGEDAPDVIVMNVHLPRLDGISTLARLRTNPATRHIPVILTAAGVDRRTLVRARESGAVDFMVQPADESVVVLKTAKALEAGRADRERDTAGDDLTVRNRSLNPVRLRCVLHEEPSIFTAYRLRPRTQIVDADYFDTPIYGKAVPRKDPVDWNLIETRVCPDCFWASSGEDFFQEVEADGTPRDTGEFRRAPRPHLIERVDEDFAERTDLAAGLGDDTWSPERGRDSALAALALESHCGRLLHAVDGMAHPTAAYEAGQAALKAARLCRTKGDEDGRNEWLRRALDDLRKAYYKVEGVRMFRVGYQLGALGIWFGEDHVAGKAFEALRTQHARLSGAASESEAALMNGYLKRLKEIWQDRDYHRRGSDSGEGAGGVS